MSIKLNHKDIVRFDSTEWTVMRHLNAEETVIIHDTKRVLAVPVGDVQLMKRYEKKDVEFVMSVG